MSQPTFSDSAPVPATDAPASVPADDATTAPADAPADAPAAPVEASPAPTGNAAATDADYQAFLAWKASQGAQTAPVSDAPQEVYLWLANGDVVRVELPDAPTASGTNATYGHYAKDGKVYLVVAQYPVEENEAK